MPRAGQRVPIKQRIRDHVRLTEAGCWEWEGKTRRGGYGVVEIRTGVGRSTRQHMVAHRVSYEAFVGPIPDGLQLDHLCRNRACVNSAHLEPVTSAENTRRGESPAALFNRTGLCKRGHDVSVVGVYVAPQGKQQCRGCRQLRDRAAREARRATRHEQQKGEL